LHANDIVAELGPARILKGRVQFRAVFATDPDADRFCRAFDLEPRRRRPDRSCIGIPRVLRDAPFGRSSG
jgi:hypothetical protein